MEISNNSSAALNKEQEEAVLHTEGPLLILAGAGTGKTRVITHRIAHLIDKGVRPGNIMAITFTNKAAGEMRDRVSSLVGQQAAGMWVSTFHSSCARILRAHAARLGYQDSFSIYDTDDSKSLIKEIIKSFNMDTKLYKEKSFLSCISKAKNDMIDENEFAQSIGNDFDEMQNARIYKEYQSRLKKNNAFDFDDLLFKTVELFRDNPDILDYYQEKFKYIHIDEYQDTNKVQFAFIKLLASKYKNLCVVGDDDQSIYKFRGADISNILNFEKYFPDAHVIKLEQNYRSTAHILDAANAVIANNTSRKIKKLWTEQSEGKKIRVYSAQTAYEEAEHVVSDIYNRVNNDSNSYNDCAIVYRTNAQSRLFEEKLIAASVPYKLIGGVNFYSRKEIKDVLAYLKTVNNGMDDIATKRIINVPRRGIGQTSITKIDNYAIENNLTFFDAVVAVTEIPSICRAASKLEAFTTSLLRWRSSLAYLKLSEIYDDIINTTGYLQELLSENTEEAKGRIENLEEFKNKIVSYENETSEPTLNGFLQDVALVADIDNLDNNDDYVVLMTMHAAKGLEYPIVYMTGMEEEVFPGRACTYNSDDNEVEEERRLCYVGMTRAKSELIMTFSKLRLIRGETMYEKPSRFLEEIPFDLLEGRKFEIQERKKERNHIESGFKQARVSFNSTAFTNSKKTETTVKSVKLEYEVGDRVRHIKFGSGTVTELIDGGRDYEVTVEFDKFGTKRLLAAFAKLVKE